MPYWVNEHNYKNLKEAIMACEEYRKNRQILEGRGLEPLPHNVNVRVSNYVDFGPPGMLEAPVGTIYIDKNTNKVWMLNSQRKWIQMLTFADFGIDYTEAVEIFSGNKKIATLYSTEKEEKIKHNCQNCGAPLHGRECEYCGTRYSC